MQESLQINILSIAPEVVFVGFPLGPVAPSILNLSSS